MTFRNIASFAFILAALSVGVYWFVTRPTAEENALKAFFKEFRLGNYSEAEESTVGDDFYAMAAASTVRDSDGAQYLIGDYFPESRGEVLRFCVETYVRPHIAQWKYLYLNTERPEPDRSVVRFRIQLSIRQFQGGNLMGDTTNGRVEGTAYMTLENDEWCVDHFDFSIFSDEHLVLSNYLRQAHME